MTLYRSGPNSRKFHLQNFFPKTTAQYKVGWKLILLNRLKFVGFEIIFNLESLLDQELYELQSF